MFPQGQADNEGPRGMSLIAYDTFSEDTDYDSTLPFTEGNSDDSGATDDVHNPNEVNNHVDFMKRGNATLASGYLDSNQNFRFYPQ